MVGTVEVHSLPDGLLGTLSDPSLAAQNHATRFWAKQDRLLRLSGPSLLSNWSAQLFGTMNDQMLAAWQSCERPRLAQFR